MVSNSGRPSQEDVGPVQSAPRDGEESCLPAADLGRMASPAPSTSSSVPGLTRAGSSPPSDQISLRSHVSIPVVGTFPLGSLRIHKAMDSPRPQRQDAPQPPPPPPPPRPEDPEEMPPLAGDGPDDPAPVPRSPLPPRGGDVFIMLDLPSGATVGCDSRAIGTGPSGSFRGIRDIPPGPHFVWVSEPDAMSRCGFWFVTHGDRGQVRVKQWDRFNEVLVNPASSFEARDQRDNVASLYPQLMPFGFGGGGEGGGIGHSADPSRPQVVSASRKAGTGEDEEDEAQLWRRLTSCVGEGVLAGVTGKAGVSEWLVDTSDSAAGDGGFPQTKTTQTYQTLVGGSGELSFLFPEDDVDVHAAAAAAAGGATTTTIIDTSRDILRLLDTAGTGIAEADLVGELQFAFLNGLHLSNPACVEQWWHLVLRVVLRAHELVLLRPRLARALLATLHAQMVYNDRYIAGGEEDGEDDPGRREGAGAASGSHSTSILDVVPGNRRKLRDALTLYKRRMDETLLNLPPPRGQPAGLGEVGEVGRAFVALEAWFWRFGWDLRTDHARKKDDGGGMDLGYEDENDDDDDYRPVIVDLDENGREVGLVSFS